MSIAGKILIYGDIHLSSKSYGAHVDYPAETLEYFGKITEIAKEEGVTHIIGTGDLTFSRFTTLEYRQEVEYNLMEQNRITGGNRYELKGNHDSATNGMTEYEFYTTKGMIKTSENIDVGCLHISMVDYGKIRTAELNIQEDGANLVIAHEYLKFKDTRLPNFGTATEIDDMERLYGADIIICGHIHKTMAFEGNIIKGKYGKKAVVYYPGCMSRPSYTKDIDKEGSIVIITVHDDGTIDNDVRKVELWPINKAFAIEEIEQAQEIKEEKENRIDISDIVKQLDGMERNIGNPEDIIMSMQGVAEKYKLKAIQLLKEA